MITKGIFEGCYVIADRVKESFRGKTAECIYCGAKMNIKRRPKNDGYYFALHKGERHTGLCKYYEGEKEMPTLKDISPEDLLSNICKPTRHRDKNANDQTTNNTNITSTINKTTKEVVMEKIRSVKKMIKAGFYFEKPLEKVDPNSNYKYIDFCVFDRSAKYLWQKQGLVDLGFRVIDGRWVGSMKFNLKDIKRIEKLLEETKQIWLMMFWKNSNDDYEKVMFCVDCHSCFSAVKEKLFNPRQRANGTWWKYAPKGCEQLELFVCADWSVVGENVCRNTCPACSPERCNGCHGAYYGLIITPKQIELFPEDGVYKRRNK